jgi:hypothetical protein
VPYYGDDYWGTKHEPKECAGDYWLVVDWQDYRFVCLPRRCDLNHFVHASCFHDEGKCRTFSDAFGVRSVSLWNVLMATVLYWAGKMIFAIASLGIAT